MTQNPADKISTTHDVEFDGDRVVKTFRKCERGEHLCEWRGLNLLHQYAPRSVTTPVTQRELHPTWFGTAATTV